MPATLSDFVSSSWKKYKSDTDTLTTWLALTAEKCGHSISSCAPQQPVPTKGPRLKGKARKEATSKVPTATNENHESKIVTTADLILFAHIIARSKVKVPVFVIQAGLRAVSSRKQYSRWYRQKADKTLTDEKSNDQHAYFNVILEEVLGILEPFVEEITTSPLKSTASTAPSSGTERLANRFGALGVHEPAELPEGETQGQESSACSTQGTPIGSSSTCYELAASDDEVKDNEIFATYCLLEDFNMMRGVIHKCWRDYKNGLIDLATASVMTNTTFEMAIRAQEDFMADFPDIKTHGDMVTQILNIVMLFRGAEFYMLDDAELFEHNFNEWMFLWPAALLEKFCKEHEGPEVLVPFDNPNLYRRYRPEASRRDMNDTTKLMEDEEILYEILPEYQFLEKVTPKYAAFPIVDELSRGLRAMFKSNKVPLWLPFAVQCYFDIHNTLRENVGRGLTDLRAIHSYARNTLDEYNQFTKACPSSRPEDISKWKVAKLVRQLDKYLRKDAMGDYRRAYLENAGDKDAQDVPFRLLTRNPILCGLLSFSLTLDLRQIGIARANVSSSIICTAHLYNAIKVNNPSIGRWEEMERAIAIHTPERVFYGGPPKTLEECERQFKLAIGISIQMSARNRRRNEHLQDYYKRKQLAQISPIVDIFHWRYTQENNTGLTKKNIEALILYSWGKTGKITSTTGEPSMYARWVATKTLSARELLTHLFVALNIEMPELTFNYLAMHQQCITLLDRNRSPIQAQLAAVGGSLRLRGEMIVQLLRPVLLSQARVLEKFKGLGPSDPRRNIRLPLDIVSDVYKEFLVDKPYWQSWDLYSLMRAIRPGASMAEIGDRNLQEEMEKASVIDCRGLARSKLIEDRLAEARRLWKDFQSDSHIPEMVEQEKRLKEMLKTLGR